jgi:predicted transcriptional regulator
VTIVRRRQSGRYAALPNALFEDDGLTVEAKGTLGYLLSRPPNWHVSLRQVGKKLNIGKDRLQRIFGELIQAGYASREQPRRRGGAFGRFE